MIEEETPGASYQQPASTADDGLRRPEHPPSTAVALCKSLLPLLLVSLAGVLIGLRTVARTILPHIVSPNQGIDYQNLTDGQPVPRLLDWNQTQIDTLSTLRELNGVGLYLAMFVLYGGLAVGVLRLLNPRFRLFRVARVADPHGSQTNARTTNDTSETDSTRVVPEENTVGIGIPRPVVLSSSSPTTLNAAIEPHGLIKAATILILLGLPVAGCWLLTSRWDALPITSIVDDTNAGRWGWIWAARMLVLFAALWVGFRPEGLAGDSDHRALNVAPQAWPRLVFTGAFVGLGAFLIGRYAVPGALEPILLRYQTLGAFNLNYGHQVGDAYLLCMATAWFAVGALCSLTCSSTRFTARVIAALAAICLAIALTTQSGLRPLAQAARYDITPAALKAIPAPYNPDRNGSGVPDGPQAALLLAPNLGINAVKPAGTADRPVVLFRDDSNPRAGRIGTQSVVTTVVQNGITTDGLPPNTDSATLAAAFLRRRNYQSALSWVATKYRYDTAVLHFDTTAALTACLDDLSYGPHPVARSPLFRLYRMPALQIEETVQALFCICAVTPQNLAQLHRWADVNLFAYPDRQSKRLIGDLYRRFADVEDALVWYRRAEMPRTFIARIRAEQPLFHTGHVEGILRLNGRPLAGVQVGMVPSKLNGLPRGLEGTVNGAIFEISADRPGGPQFDAYHPLPNAFRWISGSGVTDARGVFAIDGLTEGEYILICTLPPNIRIDAPIDTRLHVTNAPLPFNLHYGNQSVNLGIIDMYVK